MTQEEKQLLLTDLCARLPYGIIVHTWYNECIDIKCIGIDLYTNAINLDIPNDDDAKVYIDNVKPYLRPMSSMTEEEKLHYIVLGDIKRYINPQYAYLISEQLNYLNAHHFDYRGLIEKGLALYAPEGMYEI